MRRTGTDAGVSGGRPPARAEPRRAWADVRHANAVALRNREAPVVIAIRPETSDDRHAVRVVNRLAFGQDDEARLVDALRDGGHARVSLVADEDGLVVGHILFSDLAIVTPAGVVGALALAPMAVVPSHQRRGIGSRLVSEGIRACAGSGHRMIVVVGHPEFYPRFGFSATLAGRLTSPYSGPACMAIELVPGALNGVEGEVRYPPPLGSL